MSTSTRFIHTSDWQLGMTRSFLRDEAMSRFSQARIDAIRTLGDLATRHGAEFILVAGDVFESNQLSKETLLRTLNALKTLPVPIFLLPGNHDPLDAASIFATREFREAGDRIQVLRDMVPVPVPGVAAVEIAGAPWRTRHPSSDLCADLADGLQPAEGVIRIAVCHGQVDTLAPDGARPDIINLKRAERAVAEGCFHYLALGDRHSVTRVGDTGRIWYSGAPVATAFDEVDPNQALLVTLTAGADCQVESLRVGDWSFIAAAHPMNGPDDLSRFRSWLKGLPNRERSAVKVGFTGTVSLATAAALEALMESEAPGFASLEWRERTTDLAVVPDQLDQDSVSLTGYARAAWNELLAAAEDGDQTARDALMLFYRLSRQEGG